MKFDGRIFCGILLEIGPKVVEIVTPKGGIRKALDPSKIDPGLWPKGGSHR